MKPDSSDLTLDEKLENEKLENELEEEDEKRQQEFDEDTRDLEDQLSGNKTF